MAEPVTERDPRLDEALDEQIVAAATELLAEAGYDGMSMDAVAKRAGVSKATIYRRWSSKALLVLDTVRSTYSPAEPPEDTGTLRGDLLALFLELESNIAEQSHDHLGGVLVAMRSDPQLGEAVREYTVTGWARDVREVVSRAVARGEVPDRDEHKLELFSRIGPSIVALRFFMDDGPIDPAFMEELVDDVLLPVLGSESR